MKVLKAIIRNLLVLSVLIFTQGYIYSQTKGLIFEPATGAGAAVLDPNGDGYVSQTNAGFISNDQAESEIPFSALVFPFTEPTSDINNGPNCGFTDFVDSGSEDPALSYSDGTNWLFRFRMGSASPNAKSYSILIDTDGLFGNSGPDADPDYTANNPGFEVELVLATKFGVFGYDVKTPNCTPVLSYPGTTNYQKSIAHSSICNPLNYFLDFYVTWADITAQFGFDESTPIRIAIVDNMAADKSTVCNPSSASDVGGVDGSCGSLAACFETVIDNQSSCTAAEIAAGLCTDKSDCPSIDAPIIVGATTVSGTSTEADATVIEVFVNAVSVGTTTVTGGAWSLSGIIPALASSDIITATATAPGEGTSDDDCSAAVVGATCTDPVLSALECNANKAFEGTGLPGAQINVYLGFNVTPENPQSGNLFTAGAPNTITVDGTGNWLWRCLVGGQTTSCTAGGGPCLVDGNYRITQQAPGQCESDPTWVCVGLSTSTQTPIISTSPITEATTSISGTVPAPDNVATDVEVVLYVNGSIAGTTTTTAGGAWTVTGLSLNACDVVTAQAIRTGATERCVSPETAGIVVAGPQSPAPEISGTYCTSTPISTVSGTSTSAEGTIIQIFDDGVPVGATTTVLSNGTWSESGLSIAIGSIITATATDTSNCESVSTVSAGVSVLSASTNTATITSVPVIEGTTTISGTGTNGDVITLTVDGFPIPGVSATVSGGVWSITGIPAYEIYTNGLLQALATTPGFCEGPASAGTIIECIPLNNALNVTPDSEVICEGSFVANVQVDLSETLVIYQLFLNDEVTPTGSSVLGTGGTITLTSGVLTASTTLKVKALKIPPGSCETFLTDNIPVTVNAVPNTGLAVTTTSPICSGTSTAVDIALSESGFDYQLRDDSDDSNIGAPVAGTGGTISLPTGNMTATTTFNVLVTGVAPSLCSDELTTTVTVTVNICATDTDGDGVLDATETSNGTDPNDPCSYNVADITEPITSGADCDGDGQDDVVEIGNGTNPFDPCDPIGLVTTDTDGDGLTDCEETTGIDDPSTPAVPTGTSDPNDPCDPIGLITTDTDGDGLTDCEETTGVDDPSTTPVPTGTTDPNDPCDPIGLVTTDTDGDGLTDCEETTGVDDPSTPAVPTGTTDPNDPCAPIGLVTTDTDGDGLTDCEETTGIDDPSTPLDPTIFGAGPFDPNDPCDPVGINTTDTDGDGLTDCEETTGIDDPSTPEDPTTYTGPFDANDACLPIGINTTDTDGDGVTDCEETTGIDDPSTPYVPSGTSDPNNPCDPVGINTTDTDGDGVTDCEETTGIDDPSTPYVPSGTSDPNDPCDPQDSPFALTDTDGDGLTDCEETTGIDNPATPSVPTGPSDPNDSCDPFGVTTGVDFQTACDSYTWIDGNTYTASNNTATFTLTNAAGCDSIVTLDLTINNSVTNDVSDVFCLGATYSFGTQSLTTAGVYIETYTAANGCDSIVTLTLSADVTDTDGDGLTDCEETTGVDDPSTPTSPTGTSDPNDPCDPIGLDPTDTDGDGLTDCEELTGVDDPSTPGVPGGPSDPNDPCDPIKCGLEVPEGFTPDGDLVNDFFVIPGIENYPGNELLVFNRWGNKVYQVVDYDNTWDGTMNVGIQHSGNTELPTGTYFYILDTKEMNIGNDGVLQGYVYIQR